MEPCDNCDGVLKRPEANWEANLSEVPMDADRNTMTFTRTKWQCQDCGSVFARTQTKSTKHVVWTLSN
ncbi:hypothetical protein [Roseateles sp. P5_D6]